MRNTFILKKKLIENQPTAIADILYPQASESTCKHCRIAHKRPFKRIQTTWSKEQKQPALLFFSLSLYHVGEIMKEVQGETAILFFRHKIAHNLGL